mgnify:CR=1 FL=1
MRPRRDRVLYGPGHPRLVSMPQECAVVLPCATQYFRELVHGLELCALDDTVRVRWKRLCPTNIFSCRNACLLQREWQW